MANEKMLYGVASAEQQVKFAFGSGNEKFAVAAGQNDGVLSFVAGEKGGAIYVGKSLVSSRVLDYAVSGEAGKEQTITVHYLKSDNSVDTIVFKSVDASFVEGELAALKGTIDSSLEEISGALDELKNFAEGQAYKLKAITPSSDAVKEEYQLFVGDAAVTDSSTIKIYKDSAFKNAELVGEELVFTYVDYKGQDVSFGVSVADFLRQAEFKNGLEVNANGEVSVKIDAASEGFLTVSENGVKLAGVQDAINTAIETEDASMKGYVDGLKSEIDASIVRLDSSVSALETAVAKLDETYVSESELTTYKAEVSTAIADGDSSIKGYVDAQIAALKGGDESEVSLESLAQDVADLESKDASLEEEIGKNAGLIGEVSTALNDYMESADASIDAIQEQIAGFTYVETADFNAYKSEIAAAQGVQDGSINKNTEDISTLKGRVDALNDTYVSEEELTAYKAEVSTAISNAINTEDASVKTYVDNTFVTKAVYEAAAQKQDSSIKANETAISEVSTALTGYMTSNNAAVLALQNKDVEIDSSIDALEAEDLRLAGLISDNKAAADASINKNIEDISTNAKNIADNKAAADASINAINATLTWTVL